MSNTPDDKARDAVLQRMLNTPPKPKTPDSGKKKPKKPATKNK